MARQRLHRERGVDKLYQVLGASLNPKQVVLIYGEPMVGKSCLAAITARWWAQQHNSNVVVVALEFSYGEEDYAQFIKRFLEGCRYEIVTIEDLERAKSFLVGARYVNYLAGAGAVIIDSVSAFADALARQVIMKTGSEEPRVIASRVSPMLRLIVNALRDVVVKRGALGIVVAHAGSTAGTGKYRGVIDWRPSLATRCGHYITYMLHLTMWEKHPEYRRLTVVAARNRPEIEGRSALFRFVENDVEVLIKESEATGEQSG